MNLEVSGSQRRQGLLGLESPSVKHIPSMLHVLSWRPDAEQKRKRFVCVLTFTMLRPLYDIMKQISFQAGCFPFVVLSGDATGNQL